MKKSLFVLVILSFVVVCHCEAQGFLNKVKNAVSKEITGEPSGNSSAKVAPEPECACENPVLIIGLNQYKINYKEINIENKKDGSILIQDRATGKYYIVKNGVTTGPYNHGDQAISDFDAVIEDSGIDENEVIMAKNKEYISKSGEKFLIRFNGKSYGPFAKIIEFAVPKSKDKFAALVYENVLATENDNKKLAEAMEKAKTDEERMQIAMKYSQQTQEKMMQNGGDISGAVIPKLITNIEGAKYDEMTAGLGRMSGDIKYNDIVIAFQDKITDLKGNTLIRLKDNTFDSEAMFVNSGNTKYVNYNYGELTFSDNTSLAEVFNPYLTKKDDKVYLTYMYYSPAKNAIMQCYLPF